MDLKNRQAVESRPVIAAGDRTLTMRRRISSANMALLRNSSPHQAVLKLHNSSAAVLISSAFHRYFVYQYPEKKITNCFSLIFRTQCALSASPFRVNMIRVCDTDHFLGRCGQCACARLPRSCRSQDRREEGHLSGTARLSSSATRFNDSSSHMKTVLSSLRDPVRFHMASLQ